MQSDSGDKRYRSSVENVPWRHCEERAQQSQYDRHRHRLTDEDISEIYRECTIYRAPHPDSDPEQRDHRHREEFAVTFKPFRGGDRARRQDREIEKKVRTGLNEPEDFNKDDRYAGRIIFADDEPDKYKSFAQRVLEADQRKQSGDTRELNRTVILLGPEPAGSTKRFPTTDALLALPDTLPRISQSSGPFAFRRSGTRQEASGYNAPDLDVFYARPSTAASSSSAQPSGREASSSAGKGKGSGQSASSSSAGREASSSAGGKGGKENFGSKDNRKGKWIQTFYQDLVALAQKSKCRVAVDVHNAADLQQVWSDVHGWIPHPNTVQFWRTLIKLGTVPFLLSYVGENSEQRREEVENFRKNLAWALDLYYLENTKEPTVEAVHLTIVDARTGIHGKGFFCAARNVDILVDDSVEILEDAEQYGIIGYCVQPRRQQYIPRWLEDDSSLSHPQANNLRRVAELFSGDLQTATLNRKAQLCKARQSRHGWLSWPASALAFQ